jgi:EpsI family protein
MWELGSRLRPGGLRGQRNDIVCAGLIASVIVVYWPSALALWDFWTNVNHAGAHGPLVGLLCMWLLWRARHRVASASVRPSRVAAGLLFLSSVAWLVFWRAGIEQLYILLLPLMMGLAVFAALGFAAAREIALPLGYLYFAVPAWSIFVHPLQALTVDAVGVLAPLIGVPAHIEGNLVKLPGVGVFEIEGGCSGVNFLTAGLAIAVLLGEVERASLVRRGVLVVLTAIVAIVSNWVRVLTIIQAGYTTNMRHVLVSRGHYTFGWVLFTVIMSAFIWWVARPAAHDAHDPGAVRARAAPARWLAYAFTLAALMVMPLPIYVVAANDESVAPLAFVAPAGRAGWQGPVRDSPSPWKPEFVGPHSQWHSAYRGPTGRVDLVAIGYSTQAQGRELVNSGNSLFGEDDWSEEAQRRVTLGALSYIETVATDASGHRALVWSVYDIGGHEFAVPLMSQLWYGLRSFGGAPYSVLFAFSSSCAASCDGARDALRAFVQAMGPECFAAVTRAPRPVHALQRT